MEEVSYFVLSLIPYIKMAFVVFVYKYKNTIFIVLNDQYTQINYGTNNKHDPYTLRFH